MGLYGAETLSDVACSIPHAPPDVEGARRNPAENRVTPGQARFRRNSFVAPPPLLAAGSIAPRILQRADRSDNAGARRISSRSIGPHRIVMMPVDPPQILRHRVGAALPAGASAARMQVPVVRGSRCDRSDSFRLPHWTGAGCDTICPRSGRRLRLSRMETSR